MKDIDTASDGVNEFFDESPVFDGEHKRKPRNSEPTPTNLTLYRWHTPILEPDEERDLIRRARAGDERAKNELARRYHRLVLKIVRQFHGPSRDDLIGAGVLGLSEAIAGYDLKRSTGLSALAQHKIRNAIRAVAKEWRKRGQAGETREDRLLYDRPGLDKPEDIVAALEKKGQGRKKPRDKALSEADQARARRDGYWNGHEFYDTAESSHDDESDDRGNRAIVAIDVAPVEVHETGDRVSNEDWDALVACRNRDGLKPVPRPHYVADQRAAHRVGEAQVRLAKVVEANLLTHVDRLPKSHAERQTLFVYGLQRMADEADRRAERRLRAIGRRAYALELVEKDRARIAARADPRNYLYPTAQSAQRFSGLKSAARFNGFGSSGGSSWSRAIIDETALQEVRDNIGLVATRKARFASDLETYEQDLAAGPRLIPRKPAAMAAAA